MDWQRFSSHSDLNEILATLSRQKKVLEAMGVQSGPYHTFEKNVIESKENLLGGAYFSFLFGGHVASGFELWTLASNILVSLITFGGLVSCLRRLCSFRKVSGLVAAVGHTEGSTSGSTNELSEIKAHELEPLCRDASDQTSFKEYVIMADVERGAQRTVTPSAPSTVSTIPPYTPIYPNLPQ